MFVCTDLVPLQLQQGVDGLEDDIDDDTLDVDELRGCFGGEGISSIINLVLNLVFVMLVWIGCLGGEGISSIINYVLGFLGGEIRRVTIILFLIFFRIVG